MNTDRLYNVEEAAEYMRVHPRTIRRWIRLGKLEATRPGGWCWRIRREALDAMLTPEKKEHEDEQA